MRRLKQTMKNSPGGSGGSLGDLSAERFAPLPVRILLEKELSRLDWILRASRVPRVCLG